MSVTEKVTVGSIVPSKLSTSSLSPDSECGRYPNCLPSRLPTCHDILYTYKKFPGSQYFNDFEDILTDYNCPTEKLHTASAD